MKILFCGDVVGKSGRDAIHEHIPELRKKLQLDAVIVNGENAASGFGITQKICEGFVQVGVDVITGGDHCFDQKEVMHFIGNYPKLLRAANLPESLPGAGFRLFQLGDHRLVVIHLMAQLFMKIMPDSPFTAADKILANFQLKKNCDAIVVDVHGEATSERMALGHYLDGRVSLVTGSHTHVPTADAQILPNGTGYQTDAGMCGDYNSVIGFAKESSLPTFLHKVRGEKMQVAAGEATLCGTFIETDDQTGLAKIISPVRVGGRLQQSLPRVV